jgi:gluconokinase
MSFKLVFMGVAGCGKSSLAVKVARAEGLTLIEGDDFHSEVNRNKMQSGVALTDADRADWLFELGQLLKKHSNGVALTCSALKHAYRNTLREACPGLQFVFMRINLSDAQARVSARASTHFFSSSLVQSQFNTLESPESEAGVLCVNAMRPLPELTHQVTDWLHHKELA